MTGGASEPQGGDPDPTRRLRNIGIVAHINAGKTTLTERILFDTGTQRAMGDVDSGTATTDWLREEQDRGISVSAAVTTVDWRGHRIQLIDTPGHVDFAAEVERCMRVLDGAVVVLDGVRGVETQTVTVWRAIERLGVPRLVFVNKLDRATADFDRCVVELGKQLRARPVVVVAPILRDGVLTGLIDAVGRRFVAFDDAERPTAAQVEAAHHALVEACADHDEEVFADFVEGREPSPERLMAVLRDATWRHELLPVYAGSALLNRGIEPLLDGVRGLLPSPLDRLREVSDGGLLALVFKVQDHHDGDGPEALIRVYRGTVRLGDEIETGEGERFRVPLIHAVHAFERSERSAAGVGDIVAIPTPNLLRTGETLREVGSAEVLEPLRFSRPVLMATIEPRSSEGLDLLREQARSLAAEDPTLEIDEDPASGGVRVRGMGELHLEIFAERLSRVMPSPPHFGRPAVRRFETIASAAEGEAECVRALGPTTIRASANVFVEPLADRDQVRFRWAVPEGRVPADLREELSRSLPEMARNGLGSPYPPRELAVEVRTLAWDGPLDMVGPLLPEAILLACRRAVEAGGSVAVEPWAEVEVDTPNDTTGSVMADLQSRGAQITEVWAEGTDTVLQARAPLARLLGYATDLRSMTRGLGRFDLRLSGFAPVET